MRISGALGIVALVALVGVGVYAGLRGSGDTVGTTDWSRFAIQDRFDELLSAVGKAGPASIAWFSGVGAGTEDPDLDFDAGPRTPAEAELMERARTAVEEFWPPHVAWELAPGVTRADLLLTALNGGPPLAMALGSAPDLTWVWTDVTTADILQDGPLGITTIHLTLAFDKNSNLTSVRVDGIDYP